MFYLLVWWWPLELLFSEPADRAWCKWRSLACPESLALGGICCVWVCVEFCVSVPLSTVTLGNSVFIAWLFAASAALTKPGSLTSLTNFVHPLADQSEKKKLLKTTWTKPRTKTPKTRNTEKHSPWCRFQWNAFGILSILWNWPFYFYPLFSPDWAFREELFLNLWQHSFL